MALTLENDTDVGIFGIDLAGPSVIFLIVGIVFYWALIAMFELGVFKSLEKRYTKFRDAKKTDINDFQSEML